MNKLVIFKTHIIDEPTISEFNKIVKSGANAMLFIDNRRGLIQNYTNKITTENFYGLDVPCYLFDESDLQEYNLPYASDNKIQVNADRALWYNCDYSMYIIWKRFPEFDYYWQLEYDVFYNDIDYSSFFDLYDSSLEDLIGPNIQTPPTSWSNTKGIEWVYAKDILLKTFFPAIRLSSKALAYLYDKRIALWDTYSNFKNRSSFYWPHCELFVPTEVCLNHGTYRSLSNLGIFSLKPIDLCSNRFFLSYDKKLYHPIKNLSAIIEKLEKKIEEREGCHTHTSRSIRSFTTTRINDPALQYAGFFDASVCPEGINSLVKYWHIINIPHPNPNNNNAQILLPLGINTAYLRSAIKGQFSPPREFAFQDDIISLKNKIEELEDIINKGKYLINEPKG